MITALYKCFILICLLTYLNWWPYWKSWLYPRSPQKFHSEEVRNKSSFGNVVSVFKELEEASAHKRAKPTPALWFCASWPWPLTFWLQNKWFLGFMVEHFHIKFGAAAIFKISCGNSVRQTDKRRWNLTPATTVGVSNKYCGIRQWHGRLISVWLPHLA